ncbi:MAG: L-histidine N(alpha)-methyltransferase [Acidimicrobiales bacterium]
MQRQLSLDILVRPEDRRRALSHDVRHGLSGTHKQIPPTWFYDEIGSRLFDEITRLPEYYPTRAERAILAERAADIAAATGADTLVEIGSGTSEKTWLLLDAMAEAGTLRRVVLFDISQEVLVGAAEALGRRYDVDVHAVVGDLRCHLSSVPRGGRQLWAFLGGTIGNLVPRERVRLLSVFWEQLGPGGHLLLGTDLVKETGRLVAAYDDAAGVTAAFNRNVLAVINRELHATFDPRLFDHRAAWSAEHAWVEMRLRSRLAHTVTIGDLDLEVHFAEREEILTEISAKFTPRKLADELASANLVTCAAWQDAGGDFQLTLTGPQPHTSSSRNR